MPARAGHPVTVNDPAREGAAVPAVGLRELVERLETLAERRLAMRSGSDAGRTRAARLHDHLAGHVRVRRGASTRRSSSCSSGRREQARARSSTRSRAAPRARPGAAAHDEDRVVLAHPETTRRSEGNAGRASSQSGSGSCGSEHRAGLALIDAPDIDSVERANRELADRLVEAADLCLFVTTATRYADRVPWLVLGRVRERGLPLVVVVNRLPPERDDRREILDDVGRLFAEAGLRRRAIR